MEVGGIIEKGRMMQCDGTKLWWDEHGAEHHAASVKGTWIVEQGRDEFVLWFQPKFTRGRALRGRFETLLAAQDYAQFNEQLGVY